MRAIALDLDGTLLGFDRPYADLIADAFESVHGEARESWVEAYDDAFRDLFGAHAEAPVRTAFARAGPDDADPDALADALLDAEVAATSPPSGARADLDRLAADHRLGVLTNGVPEWQRRKLGAHGLDEAVDAVVTSYEAGAHKPDPAPFRLFADRLPADDYAMVGDADADVEGARAVGWHARRYAGEGFADLPDALEW